ncbi:MAG: assimilatory sulfite reductase (NADPH) flavoprotein subunit [Methylococcaceae bacterium]|nr:assimilatory sulfite reductase (NADPH) flavoprotein subunit [Methylococcaceae bacterium]
MRFWRIIMIKNMTLIPVRTSRQGTSLNAGKLKKDYQAETSTIELHREDMAELGVKKGDKVKLKSENGMEAVVVCKDRKGEDATAGLIFMAYGPTSSLFMDEDTAGSGMPLSKHLAIDVEGPVDDDGNVISSTVMPLADGSGFAGQAGSLLAPHQTASLNALLESAINPMQAAWLSGYFAALSGQPISSGVAVAGVALPLMTILYGSQTGNGEGLAENFHEQAQGKGFNSRVLDMSDFEPSSIANEEILFIIVSTHGEGEPPIAAEKLHGYLEKGEAASLDKLKYAVFALGDSSYEFFCKTGKDFDDFLEKAGAARLLDRVDADIDFEEPAEAWIESLLESYQVLAGAVSSVESTAKKSTAKSDYSKTNPYYATVLDNYNLNGEDSAKETRHVEIDLGDSKLSYEAGDALGIYPLNNADYVDEFIAILAMDWAQMVTIGKETLKLRDAFIEKMDVTALSRINMEKYADLIGSDKLKTLLDDAHKQEFSDYIWGRQILDLVEDYPAVGISAQDFIGVLRKIPARLYSIASSIKAYPNQVHLLIGAVRYNSFDRDREGVCSTYLSGRMTAEQKLAVYVQPNKNFRLPENPEVPVIMVGPGTGLAPFCSFLQERQAIDAKGKNWLFFGDQHEACDFLYADKLTKQHEDGLLTKLSLAFSRDQEQKIYVQTRILEASKEIYEWLEAGAYFYICGDASRMATDVHNALIESVAKEGGKSQQEAEDYINALVDAKRYQRDVY